MTDKQSEFDIIETPIEQELKTSYIDYAMNVITSRAIPDIRDGLKPVQRRILYAMKTIGNTYDKPFKKSARIVGEVVGKYHPHGNEAVYDAITRMTQSFSCNYPLIDGQGNFGSIDGDAPAAMRYTGLRISKFGQYMINDLEKDTVQFSLNYDDTELLPDVLPCQVPNLLINGASGIAVGMATHIPPHNLVEVINATIALISDKDISIIELMDYVHGPSFPTGATMCGRAGIVDAYETGKGRILLRAKTTIDHGKKQITVTELPYQVNKAALIEDLAQQVNLKKIEGISDIRDESDQKGISITIQVKKDAVPEVVLNNLYANSKLQTYFHVNFVAIDSTGSPKTFNIKEALEAFLDYRISIITKKTVFELKKAQNRLHILQGLAVAILYINDIVENIKQVNSFKEAKEYLSSKSFSIENLDKAFMSNQELLDGQDFFFSTEQIHAVLDLKITNLTNLESSKIKRESLGLMEKIVEFNRILSSRTEILNVIIQELETIKQDNDTKRLTSISDESIDIEESDLISPEEMVISFSKSGYIKSQRLNHYNIKNRGAVGVHSSTLKEEDNITHVYTASKRSTMLCFSNQGRVYWLRTYHIPEMDRAAKGKPISNLLSLNDDEQITYLIPLVIKENTYLFFTTKNGIVKRADLSLFFKVRTTGLKFITLKDDDMLAYVNITSGADDIMIFSSSGKVCRFEEQLVRSMGRQASGVRGMILMPSEHVVSVLNINPEEQNDVTVLTVTENGYGKRSQLDLYRKTNRSAKGIKAIASSSRNGNVVSAAIVKNADTVLLITDSGVVTRMYVNSISLIKRVTQGVRLMTMRNNSKVIALSIVKDQI